MDDIKCRLAIEADSERINAFHNGYYGSTRDGAAFRWEFAESPAGVGPYVIAEHDGRIVGTQAAIPVRMRRQDGSTVLTAKSEDTLIDPEMRGRKLLVRMYEVLFSACRNDGVEAVWGFTPLATVWQRLGFEIPFHHDQVVQVHRVPAAFRYFVSLADSRSITSRLKIAGLCAASWMKPSLGARLSSGFTVRAGSPSDPNVLLDQILRAEPSEGAFSIDLSGEYVRWRIDSNPHYAQNFSFVLFDSTESECGWMVIIPGDNSVAHVAVLLCAPEIPHSIVAGFVRYVSSELRRNGLSTVRNWTFRHTEANLREGAAFRSAGYIPLSRGIAFVWKSLAKVPSLRPSEFVLSRLATQGLT